jgi:hypothetical protein
MVARVFINGVLYYKGKVVQCTNGQCAACASCAAARAKASGRVPEVQVTRL